FTEIDRKLSDFNDAAVAWVKHWGEDGATNPSLDSLREYADALEQSVAERSSPRFREIRDNVRSIHRAIVEVERRGWFQEKPSGHAPCIQPGSSRPTGFRPPTDRPTGAGSPRSP